MKLIRVSMFLLLVLAITAMTVLGQETHLYEDPAGRFSVPIPPGWADESTTEIGRYVGSDGISVAILALEAADATSGDQAILAALAPELAGTAPVQTAPQASANGNWVVNIYAPAADRLVAMTTQWIDGVTYALLFDIPGQESFALNQGNLLSMLNGYFVGEQLDLSGVTPKPFTDEMLADLAAHIDAARERFHVPGVAIALVQNGEVVYTGGFGSTAPENGKPITADTLFMIGSVTKSMTTMMISTLVDEGVIDWDQPVTDILPSFALSDPAATAKMRVRDLLNMSSGVPRYDIILQLAALSPQEMIASLADIPLVSAPGTMWNYSNQMVATGGFLSALAAGSPADGLYQGYIDLVQKRVFDAIEMPNTTFDFDAALANPNHALPSIYIPATQKFSAVPFGNERFVLPTAPAGAVWSNVKDMARYLQTELSGGVSPDGKRIVSELNLRTTQSAEITPGGLYASYGMGWGLDDYNGQRVVVHGGNTLGFTSDLAFMPDADFGLAILIDAGDANAFYQNVRQYVFELAFGLDHVASERVATVNDEQEAAQQSAPSSLSAIDPETVKPYLGSYEYGATLEMRGAELWLTGAFVETQLVPSGEADTFAGVGVYRSLGIHFAHKGDQFTMEISFPSNPNLTVSKVE